MLATEIEQLGFCFFPLNQSPLCFQIENKTSRWEKIWNASRICVSSLRRGHANLLCIVPILVYVTEVTSIPKAPSLYILAQLSRKKQICTLRSIQPPIWSPLFIILDWLLQLSSWFWELFSFTNFFNILIKAQDWICSYSASQQYAN